jgi:hypothetical protein
MGLTAGVEAGGVAHIQFFAPRTQTSWVKKATGRGKLSRKESRGKLVPSAAVVVPSAAFSLVPCVWFSLVPRASCCIVPRAWFSLVPRAWFILVPRASCCLVPKAAWYIVEWRRLVG